METEGRLNRHIERASASVRSWPAYAHRSGTSRSTKSQTGANAGKQSSSTKAPSATQKTKG